jgi:hypothetical protein
MCDDIITRKVNILSAFELRYSEVAVQSGSNNQVLAQWAMIKTLLALRQYWNLVLLQYYFDDSDWNKKRPNYFYKNTLI